MNMDFSNIGKRIQATRMENKISQKEMADFLGISMNYIAKIESKKMQRGFTIVVLGRIADALNIDIKNLFDK